MASNPEAACEKTVVVTVTYGNRREYVERLVHTCLDQEKVDRIIIVRNGSKSSFRDLVQTRSGKVECIEFVENLGSAGGYAAGIKEALKRENPFLWLLDDDNLPQPGSLRLLHKELLDKTGEVGVARTAVLANRPAQLFLFTQKLATGELPEQIFPARSCFLGFHLGQWLKRKRNFRVPPHLTSLAKPLLQSSYPVPFAPYGGFLAHRDVFQNLGLPKTDFILYGDDTEYTYRLTSGGGKIFLCLGARIEDVEASWYTDPGVKNPLELRLKYGSDRQVYFSTRNQAFFDRHHWKDSEAVYAANRWAFFTGVALMALQLGKKHRFRLLWQAVKDGEAGCLGTRKEFPLL